ncbi:MAG: UDP-N-acetylmuramate dehydrogenase [Patescibacteria group bacterium]
MDTLNKLKAVVSGSIKEREILAPYTTFNIGGAASYFYLVNNSDEMIKLVAVAEKKKLSYLILGGGSNLLISDQGFQGLVIKNNCAKIRIKNDLVEAEAGVLLSKLLGETMAGALLGLEWATGIPGTVGGAVCNNAGAYGGQMSDNIIGVKIIRNGKIKELTNKKCQFAYRESIFKKQEKRDVILSVVLKLKKGSAVQLMKARENIKLINKKRGKKFSSASAGSVFKNIFLAEKEIIDFKNKFSQLPEEFMESRKIPAAWLIDQCGLKGRAIGGAKVSEEHAGIIINTGTATAENVIMLISVIKQKVRSKFNLQLMEEVEYVGF